MEVAKAIKSEALRTWGEQSKSLEVQKKILGTNETTLTEKQAEFKRVLAGREIMDWRNTLSELQVRKGFEQARAKLREGELCPLCGAKEHPFTAGNNLKVKQENNENLESILKIVQAVEAYEKEISTLRDSMETVDKCSLVKKIRILKSPVYF